MLFGGPMMSAATTTYLSRRVDWCFAIYLGLSNRCYSISVQWIIKLL